MAGFTSALSIRSAARGCCSTATAARRRSDRCHSTSSLTPHRGSCRSRSTSRHTPTPALAARTARVLCERYRRTRQRERIEVISFHSSACAVAAAHGFASRLVDLRRLRPRGARGLGDAAWVERRLGRALPADHEARQRIPARRAERQHRHRQRRRAPAPSRRRRRPGRGLLRSPGGASPRSPAAGRGWASAGASGSSGGVIAFARAPHDAEGISLFE